MAVICHPCKDQRSTRRAMTCTGETPEAWLFACRYCGSRRAVTKDKVGGQVGAGDRRGDGRRTTTGRGF